MFLRTLKTLLHHQDRQEEGSILLMIVANTGLRIYMGLCRGHPRYGFTPGNDGDTGGS